MPDLTQNIGEKGFTIKNTITQFSQTCWNKKIAATSDLEHFIKEIEKDAISYILSQISPSHEFSF
ncbi:unnamed protein product [Paramecium sonneborni]|uniref:Uncharacterized protein n=1 Tax=Paramecium sonneborni TaxID=65129 RepID=A0A8S1RDX7_9CILI|nr:unnamed protein product [Paramecium sonneborni]